MENKKEEKKLNKKIVGKLFNNFENKKINKPKLIGFNDEVSYNSNNLINIKSENVRKKSYKLLNIENSLISKQEGYNNKSNKLNAIIGSDNLKHNKPINNLDSSKNHNKSGNVKNNLTSKYNLDNKLNKKINLTSVCINSRLFFMLIFLLSVLTIFSITSISAQSTTTSTDTSQVSYCCEKTLSGAYCQNAPLEQCDRSPKSNGESYSVSPTSCESTSYCKKGCCYDSNEGICAENTPREACKANNGVWSDSPTCQIAQCNLGCCVLGTQAAYVPLVRCKKLSALYGLQTDFRLGIPDELSCIALANAQDIGACIYESEFTSTCKFTTRGECQAGNLGSVSNSTSVKFYKDYLCTAPELGANCQPTEKTTCADGKDGVYFLDSCGNAANLYDASKIFERNKGNKDVVEYWTKVKKPEESCGVGSSSGNADSKSCGNCDYLGGSICAKSSRGEKPKYGDYICRDINCEGTSNGKDYKNGESWCVYDQGKKDVDSVGSRYFRHLCFMGEEIVEPCEDFRNQVCVENTIESEGTSGGFSQAGCVVNRWQDCILQNSSQDCENTDKRDCKWVSLAITAEQLKEEAESRVRARVSRDTEEKGRCVPDIAPGLEFWDASSEAQCKLGSQSCVVKYEKRIVGGKKCVENCECLTEAAKLKANQICNALGDCGAKQNYIGKFVNAGYKISVNKQGKEEKEPNQGGSAQPGAAQQTQPPTVAAGQTFDGRQGQTFGGAAQPGGTGSGNVIQGLVVRTYNKIAGVE
ncbi:hypothetical protein HYW74_00755 [Candidatus Pacearchaeota archaeon]|nr:hypothetical protein [Candidatus Pacearchaeota archaeon]